jgi:hypothetical protein
MKHPANSPDLNPQEAVWNILKQRVRRHVCSTIPELKKALLEEWDRIELSEIRRRVSEMPKRCQMVIESGGKPFKSSVW